MRGVTSLLLAHVNPDASVIHRYDIFLSYRRADFAVADLVCDKLQLQGVPSPHGGPPRPLAVFKDRLGHSALIAEQLARVCFVMF